MIIRILFSYNPCLFRLHGLPKDPCSNIVLGLCSATCYQYSLLDPGGHGDTRVATQCAITSTGEASNRQRKMSLCAIILGIPWILHDAATPDPALLATVNWCFKHLLDTMTLLIVWLVQFDLIHSSKTPSESGKTTRLLILREGPLSSDIGAGILFQQDNHSYLRHLATLHLQLETPKFSGGWKLCLQVLGYMVLRDSVAATSVKHHRLHFLPCELRDETSCVPWSAMLEGNSEKDAISHGSNQQPAILSFHIRTKA